MLSYRIRFIVFIVSCSLAGIFFLQAYWLINFYQVTTKQFDKEVNDVLQKLKSDHAILEMRASGLISSNDGLLKESERSLLTYLQSASSTIKFSQDSGRSGIMKLNTVHDYKKNELAGFGKSLSTGLDSLLKSRRISAAFNYSIANSSGSGSKYFSDSTGFRQNGSQMYQVRIGLTRPYVLSLVIQSPLSQVLKKMQWTLLASVFIIGITTWAFVYLLRTIFQQKRVSEVKNDFINNMTHEFKTPIATVSLAVEALKSFNVMNKPAQAAEYLDICQHELRRITLMIEKVLKFAAFERSEVKLSLQKANLGQLVNDVVANMRLQLEEKGALLSIKALNGPVACLLDYDHFSGVIYNLIDNSLKYVIKDPEIVISYGKNIDAGTAELIISDNGVGIPAVYGDKVFESFFRVPKGNLYTVEGFGLGLSYVAGIVKQHGGTIAIRSEEGNGSAFIISLPLAT